MIINRRQLRIKVLQMLYAFEQTDEALLGVFEKNLTKSIEMSFDLYLTLLDLLIEIRWLAKQKIDESKTKLRPEKKDLYPNLAFINNPLLLSIYENEKLRSIIKSYGVSWDNDRETLHTLFNKLRHSELYMTYLEQENHTLEEDISFMVKLFKDHIINEDVLLSFFEEKSILWIEDIDLVASMVIKSFKRSIDTAGNVQIYPLFKEEKEERDFYKKLFRSAIMDRFDIDALIKDHTKNWDIERIALMDILLMRLAVAEVTSFSSIPVKVTLNEYIELAKFYSTSKSNIFINGILDKVFLQLKEDGKIKKTGRGLLM